MQQDVDQESFEKTVGVRPTTSQCPKCGLDVSVTQSTCPVDGTPISPLYSSGMSLDGKYEFIELIGSGGMGVIYKARQIILNKIVAIKMLHTDLINDKAMKRFQREGKAASALSHPNIIAVHDFAVSQHGQPYLVMDYVEGLSLEEKINSEGSLPIDFTIEAMMQICDGLGHAHKNGVLHRDLKPSNIVIVDNGDKPPTMKILDFGIAKIIEGAGSGSMALTQTGDTLGSPLYMSPEQCFGKEIDKRSELWALGCTMYECLTGLPPFVGATLPNIIIKISNEPPPSMKDASLGRDYPPALENIVLKLLRKDPDERYQSTDELKWALQQFLEGVPEVQPSTRIDVSLAAAKPGKSTKLAAAVSAAVCILALVLVGYSIQQWTMKVPVVVAPVLPAQVNTGIGTANDTAVSNMNLKTAVADWVRKNPNAVTINLGYWEISDDDMAPLGQEAACLVLNLPGNSIKGYGLKYLAPMTRLTSLRIDKNDIADDALVNLQKMTSLNSLNLKQTRIKGSGLSYLKSCPLAFLDLSNTKVDHAGLSPLKAIKTLGNLNFGGTLFNNDCVDYLTQMHDLRVLDLSHTQISDPGIAKVAKLDPVRELFLTGTAIDDKCMKDISRMKNLIILDVSGTAVTSEGIKQLAACKSLGLVYCAGCSGPLVSAAAEIKKHLPNCAVLANPRKGT